MRRDYVANDGWETFLSYEDPEQDILIGLLRLRKCSEETFRAELKGGVSIVRELHVYGSVVPVSARDPSKFQHQVRMKNVGDFNPIQLTAGTGGLLLKKMMCRKWLFIVMPEM